MLGKKENEIKFRCVQVGGWGSSLSVSGGGIAVEEHRGALCSWRVQAMILPSFKTEGRWECGSVAAQWD